MKMTLIYFFVTPVHVMLLHIQSCSSWLSRTWCFITLLIWKHWVECMFIMLWYKQHFEYHGSFGSTVVSQYFFMDFFVCLLIILRFAFKQCLNLNQDRSQCSLELLTVPWRQLGKRLDQLEKHLATKILSLERQCIAYVAQCKLSQQFLELREPVSSCVVCLLSLVQPPKDHMHTSQWLISPDNVDALSKSNSISRTNIEKLWY